MKKLLHFSKTLAGTVLLNNQNNKSAHQQLKQEQNIGQEEGLHKSNVRLGSLEEVSDSHLIDSTCSEALIHYSYYGNIHNQIASEQFSSHKFSIANNRYLI